MSLDNYFIPYARGLDDTLFRKVTRRPDRRLSDDGSFCLSEAGVKQLDRANARAMVLKTQFGELIRRFVPVDDGENYYYADCITGSLYRQDGTSPSGGRMKLKVTP